MQINTRIIYSYLKALIKYYAQNKEIRKLKKIKVADADETIEYLLNNECSMSRYGDGEFQLVWQYLTGKEYLDKYTFQNYDGQLAKRLYDILLATSYNNLVHIVCIPYVFLKNWSKKNIKAQIFILSFISQHIQLLKTSLNPIRNYYDSNITRFYLSEKNKGKAKARIFKIRKLWEGKNVCFIEGDKSRLGVGNDLFDNALSQTRILCPSENAFSHYEEIISAAKDQPNDTLFLLALGMTATVLAYDLSKIGYRALDLGHIDIEYEWMLMGAKEKVAIPNKYTNEANGGKTVSDEQDSDYLKSIIRRIGC